MNFNQQQAHDRPRVFDRETVARAMKQPGFENWTPTIDVRHINRPRQRPIELPGDGRFAAVLLLLFQSDDRPNSDTQMVLTRRRDDLKHHAGQISLPGGSQEPNESLERTALRETWEEIGVPVDAIQILGKMTPIYVPPSDFTVQPFVGWLRGEAAFVPQPSEVAEVIEVPVKHLVDPKTLREGEIKVDGRVLQAPFFAVDHHRVWGATAVMINELIDRLKQVTHTKKG